MSLFTTTFIIGVLLVFAGSALAFRWQKAGPLLKVFPRSVKASYVTMGIGTLWFLYHILNLGLADFGQYRQYLLLGFAAVGLLSFKFAPDFLAVRGLCVIILLAADAILDSAFRQEPTSRLFLVTLTYLLIVIALWFGASPFRMRDFIDWLHKKSDYPKKVGFGILAYGLILLGVAFTY